MNTVHAVQADREVADLESKVDRFARVYTDKAATWRARLRELARDGRRVVVWGAGSKGVSFMNALQPGDQVACLVDVNPHKQGRYVPGTGHQVRAPRDLAQIRPDTVVVLNPQYRDEIDRDLRGLGVAAEILVDEVR
jgi:FlaA1/EpsC-like NDP-sugar epimerase